MMETNIETEREGDATGEEGGVGHMHPDFPLDPSTDRSRCKLRGVWAALESSVRALPGAVRAFENLGERTDLEKARELRSLVQQNVLELKMLKCKEYPEEAEQCDELLKAAETELGRVGARLDIGGGGEPCVRV